MRYLTAAANEFKRVVRLLCGRIRDLDNLLNGLLDSISAAGVIVDDCQVDEIQMRREGVTKGGKIQVWVLGIEN